MSVDSVTGAVTATLSFMTTGAVVSMVPVVASANIKKLAALITKLTKTKSKLKFSKKLRSGETPRLLCDYSLAKKITKWKPAIDLENGLLKTIEYYKERKHLVSNLPFML